MNTKYAVLCQAILEAINDQPGRTFRPMDVGGTDGSPHGWLLRRMAAAGLIERLCYPSLGGQRTTYHYQAVGSK